MDPIPSNTTQLTVPVVDLNDPLMSDKFALDRVEQLVVNGLNDLGMYMAKEEAAERDREEDEEDIKKENIKTEDGIELLKARITDGLGAIVLNRVRGVLYNDMDIHDSAKHFKQDPDSRFTSIDENVAEFLIVPDRFHAWMEQHQRGISTNFVYFGKYQYPVVDQYRVTYRCQCAGKKDVRKNVAKGGKSGKTRMRKEGIKTGCLSKIHALFKPIPMADGSNKPGCIVEYHYQHNHSVGDITDIDTRQKSAAITATIERLLRQGSTIQRVMQQLTLDYDKFTQITRGNEQQLSRDDFITYDDVYNIWHRIITAQMRKDPDPVVSAIKWMEEFEKDNAFTFYDKDGLYFGFASLWQLQQLKSHGRAICFDGTHNVFGHATNLFTLVVKNSDTGFGIPVAFLVTKTCDAFILSNWLLAICRKMKDLFSADNNEYNFLPNAIITDQGGSEILAMKTVFPGVPILYCAWHVLRVWERQVKSKMTGLGAHSVKERERIRAHFRSDLRKILYERKITMAQELIKAFRETWSNQTELLEYLNKNYFGRPMFEPHERQVKEIQETWMLCYRQDISYASIDTNNYIESWHNTLKRHFFRDKQQRRPDTVIYVLAVLAVPHFQQKCIRSIVNVGRMNPAQSEELRLTVLATEHIKTRESRGYTGAYIKQTSDVTLYVESFTDPGTGRIVNIDFSKSPTGHIIECSCTYFRNNKSCCKHIALVQVELHPLTFLRADFWEHQANFHPGILESHINDDPATTDVPEADLLDIYYQRYGLLKELWDKKADYPLRLQAEAKFKEALDLFESSFPRLPGQGFNNKRPRQH